MAVSTTVRNTLSVTEVLPNNASSLSTGQQLTHSAFDFTFALSGTTTPPIDTHASFVATLSAGALTLNLTTLTGTNGAVVDLTGKKLRVLKVNNLGGNDLTIKG